MSIVSQQNTALVINQFLSNIILSTPTPALISSMFSQPTTIPYNSGNQFIATRMQPLDPAVTAFPTGSDGPPPQQLKRDLITVSLSLYGRAVYFDTRILEQDELPWLTLAAERLADSLRQGQQLLTFMALDAGTSVYECKYGSNGDSPTEQTLNDYLEVYAALQQASAPFVTQLIQGTLQFDTVPVQSCYFVMINPALQPNLYQMEGFAPTANYAIKSDERAPSEFGTVQGFRFWTSPRVPVLPHASTNGRSVAVSYVGGAQPYITTFLDSDNLQTLYRPPIYSNAYGLQASLSTTGYFGATVSQPTWVLRMHSSVN